MPELYTISMRKDRMAQAQKILEVSMPIEFEKAISLVVMNIGISSKTAREYVTNIMTFNDWIIKDGIIQKPTV